MSFKHVHKLVFNPINTLRQLLLSHLVRLLVIILDACHEGVLFLLVELISINFETHYSLHCSCCLFERRLGWHCAVHVLALS